MSSENDQRGYLFEFSYDRIATLGVRARDIFDALVRQNAVTPSGSIDTQNQQVYIRLDGALNDLEKIRDTPIVSGRRTLKSVRYFRCATRLRRSCRRFLVRHNGQPAIGVPGLKCASGEERHWTRRAYGTRQEVPA